MYDVIIIGKGPAGAQAGIYLGRARIQNPYTLQRRRSLEKADYVENYYGFVNLLKKSCSKKEWDRPGGLMWSSKKTRWSCCCLPRFRSVQGLQGNMSLLMS